MQTGLKNNQISFTSMGSIGRYLAKHERGLPKNFRSKFMKYAYRIKNKSPHGSYFVFNKEGKRLCEDMHDLFIPQKKLDLAKGNWVILKPADGEKLSATQIFSWLLKRPKKLIVVSDSECQVIRFPRFFDDKFIRSVRDGFANFDRRLNSFVTGAMNNLTGFKSALAESEARIKIETLYDKAYIDEFIDEVPDMTYKAIQWPKAKK